MVDGPRRAVRGRRPRAQRRDRRLPRHDDRDERRARARGRGRRDDHDARLPRHRPHRPPPAAAPLLGDAGHPVAGAAVRAAPPPQGRDRADRAADRARCSTPLDEDEVRAAARELRDEGVEAVAVCFLFSYLNPEHERRAAAIVREEMPDAFVTTSADIFPQFREFERFTTATMSAFVGPEDRHLPRPARRRARDRGRRGRPARDDVERRRRQRAHRGRAARDAAALRPGRRDPRRPVGRRARRPAAADHVRHGRHLRRHRDRHRGRHQRGVGARHLGRRLSAARADARRPRDRRRRRLDRVRRRGRRVPRRPAQRRRRARPRRATARAAQEPTITRRARRARPARPGALPRRPDEARPRRRRRRPSRSSPTELGLGLLETAEGILTIANSNMARAIRSRTIEKGHDPREFALVAFGGAGPLHAAEVADSARDPGGARAAVPRHHLRRRPAHERPQVRPDAHRLPAAGQRSTPTG